MLRDWGQDVHDFCTSVSLAEQLGLHLSTAQAGVCKVLEGFVMQVFQGSLEKLGTHMPLLFNGKQVPSFSPRAEKVLLSHPSSTASSSVGQMREVVGKRESYGLDERGEDDPTAHMPEWMHYTTA